jgi:cation transport protein ChaC
VVTLVPSPGEHCWGVAYRVEPELRSEVLERLDHRESGGFDRLELEVRFADPAQPPRSAIVYVAGEANPNFLGPASPAAIVAQVRAAHGPSGANVEYVLRLAEALRELGAEDPHVFEVAEQLAAASKPR